MRFQVNCSARSISVPGMKSIDNSAEPRMVFERTWATPGTVLTASSSGRVSSTCALATPKPGTLATTVIRGKLTSG